MYIYICHFMVIANCDNARKPEKFPFFLSQRIKIHCKNGMGAAAIAIDKMTFSSSTCSPDHQFGN